MGGTEETSKDYLKNVDWKTLGNTGSTTNEASTGPVFKKRLPKKLRQVPDYYFLPRMSVPSALALSALACAAGVGAGMLVEGWVNKKVQGFVDHFSVVICQSTFLELVYNYAQIPRLSGGFLYKIVTAFFRAYINFLARQDLFTKDMTARCS